MGYTVRYARGCDVESNDTSGFDEAVTAAKGAELVVFVGGNRNCEGRSALMHRYVRFTLCAHPTLVSTTIACSLLGGQGVGGGHCESEGHDRPDLAMPGVQVC